MALQPITASSPSAPAGSEATDPDDAPVPHITHDPATGHAYPDPTVREPDFVTLAGYLYDALATATDGWVVEPDGRCPHGHPSWLRRLGVV